MRESFLLGAGASVGIGLPTAVEATKQLLQEFDGRTNLRALSPLLRQVYNHLSPHGQSIDFETLGNAVLQLARRESLELSRFVMAWDPPIYDIEQQGDRWKPQSGVKYLEEQCVWFEMARQMRDVLKTVLAVRQLPRQDIVFSGAPEERVQVLRPILKAWEQQGQSLVVATLNYDEGVEVLAQDAGVPLDDKLNGWLRMGSVSLRGSKIHLLKLHGSVTWAQSEQVHESGQMPARRYWKIREAIPERSAADAALIFGSHNKLTAEGPFLSLLDAWARALEASDRLNVVGYSFRDEHINLLLSRWLNARASRCLRIINGPDTEKNLAQVPYGKELLLFRQGAPARVEIVPLYADKGLAACFG